MSEKYSNPDRGLAKTRLDFLVNQAVSSLKLVSAQKKNTYMLSSFGVNSALLFQLVKEAGVNLPVLTVDTGFWYSETYKFKDKLVKAYGSKLVTASPSKMEVDKVLEEHLWLSDLKKYHKIVKLNPLNDTIESHGIEVLVSAIRRGQTENREHLTIAEKGRSGELRVHPIIDWRREDVELFFETRNLPKHPLSHLYASIGDWTTTRPGESRAESRNLENGECGIHITEDGNVKTNSKKDLEEDNGK